MKKIDASKLPSWDGVRDKWMEDPEFKAAYDVLEPEYALAKQFIDMRIKHKLTQAQLAQKLDMKQSAIARLESGHANPSYKTLYKISSTLGQQIRIG